MSRIAMRLRHHWHIWVLMVVAYVPMITTGAGRVSADTKTYLFLDPGALLAEASSLWSSSFGAGTVTHQYIGYLWPMGPYFWLSETIGLPDWLAQRLWWGSLIFMASLGAHRLARHMGVATVYALVAGLFYGLSPYSLHYIARLSGILLPWVGLPWLIVCLVRLRRERSWRWVATSALIIATVGTVNATALLYVVMGVGLWLFCDALAGLARWRDAFTDLVKIAASSLLVSLWWMMALVTQSRYGLPMLRYTETYETVAKASLPQELLRGLGYWFFYGGDESGRWIGPSATYLTNPVIILAGFMLALVALVAVGSATGAHRMHVAIFTVVGLALSVGAAPIGSQPLFGRLFEALMGHEAGFALRSTPRALPLVLLAFSIAIGLTLHNLSLRTTTKTPSSVRPVMAMSTAALVMALVVANNFPWFTGRVMTESITRSEDLPTYWTEMARAIDALRDQSGYGRTYEFPASNFADHWWGGTVDPVLKGLMSTEYLAKEMVPLGSEATTDLLSAFESRLVDGRADTATLTSLAQILSANTVSWRADLAYDHFLTARPEYLAPLLQSRPPGTSLFEGPSISTNSRAAIVDESWYAHRRVDSYPLLQAWTIPDPRPLVSVSDPSHLTTLVGSGQGVLDALAAGALSANDTFVYAGSRRYLPETLSKSTIDHLIITDTNRKAERQWSSIAQQTGRTEARSEPAVTDKPTDQRLNPFTDDHRAPIGIDEFSTSRLVGSVSAVRASSYGHPVVLTPEARPEHAVDGDPRTAWVVGVRGRAVGEWIRIEHRSDVTTDSVEMDFTIREPGDRVLQEVRLDLFDDAGAVVRTLVEPIEMDQRQAIRFPTTTFRSLMVTITKESYSNRIDHSLSPGIAISEIQVPGSTGTEFIEVPRVASGLLASAARATFVLTRQGIDASIPHRADQETALRRIIDLDSGTTVTVFGTARMAGRAAESLLSRETSMTMAQSDQRLWGAVNSIASLALDGDPTTAWITPLDTAIGATLRTRIAPNTNSRTLRLSVVDDRFHSVPTRILVTDRNGEVHVQSLEPSDGHLVTTLPDGFAYPLTSLTIDEVRSRTFANYFSKQPRLLPVAITEIDFGVDNRRVTPTLSQDCRDDLLSVNGVGVPIRLSSQGSPLDSATTIAFSTCAPVVLGDGENLIESAKGLDTGIDIDQLVVEIGATKARSLPPLAATVRSRGATRIAATIDTDGPAVVSFAQSVSRGWRASLRTATDEIDLGTPFVVQGYANGWVVPTAGELVLTWEPQKVVRTGLIISVLSAVVLLFVAARRHGTRVLNDDETRSGSLPPDRRRGWLIAPVGLLFAAIAGPIPGVVAVGALFVPRRLGIAIVAICMAIVGGVVVFNQTRFGYPPTLDWPLRFADLARVSWVAVAVAAINPLLRRSP